MSPVQLAETEALEPYGRWNTAQVAEFLPLSWWTYMHVPLPA